MTPIATNPRHTRDDKMVGPGGPSRRKWKMNCMKKVWKISRALSDEGVSRAGRHALPAHKKEDQSNRYGGQTGIRLRVTIPRVVQRNRRKSRPGIPAKGAWHAIFKLSLIPQSLLLQPPKWLRLGSFDSKTLKLGGESDRATAFFQILLALFCLEKNERL